MWSYRPRYRPRKEGEAAMGRALTRKPIAEFLGTAKASLPGREEVGRM